MNTGDLSRKEVEAKLAVVGDYVKMDYLQQCLKKNLDFDTRKYVLVTLSSIYESRKMFLEAGKLIRNAAEINTTFEGKMNDFMKSVELFVKSGNYDDADISFAKALACANEMQKPHLKARQRAFYKTAGQEYMGKDKRKHAMDAYEKLWSLDLAPDEKQEVRSVLMQLYEKLGKIKEFYALQRSQ